MSDENTTEATVEETTEGAPAGEPTEPTTEETTEPKAPEEPGDDLPEGHWARKEMTKLRGESANYRTQLREVQKQLSEAKTPEDVEAVRTELGSRISELEHLVAVSDVARKYDIPDTLLPLLKNVSGDELETAAKALQSHAAPAAPEHLSGGLDPDDGDESFDPYAVAHEARRSRF